MDTIHLYSSGLEAIKPEGMTDDNPKHRPRRGMEVGRSADVAIPFLESLLLHGLWPRDPCLPMSSPQDNTFFFNNFSEDLQILRFFIFFSFLCIFFGRKRWGRGPRHIKQERFETGRTEGCA
jgi:hypothetical protein